MLPDIIKTKQEEKNELKFHIVPMYKKFETETSQDLVLPSFSGISVIIRRNTIDSSSQNELDVINNMI